MPGVNSKGESEGGYGYDVGGKTQAIKREESESTSKDSFPPGGYQGGNLGKLDKLNTDRFIERKPDADTSKSYSVMGYEGRGFDKDGNVKGGPKSDVSFLEKDGSWAPAEGRGGVGNITPQGRNIILKK